MDRKTFNVNGREKESYQLSNREMVDLIKNDERACSDDREYLLDKMLDRFEYDLCPKCGENENNVFARFFSSFVNGKWVHYYDEDEPNRIGKLLCREHRYLQNEMFKVCMEYIKELAKNCESGYYDPRNQYAAKTSKKIIDFFKEIDYPY